MAMHGRKGTVSITAGPIGEVTAWSYEETIDTVETTAMSTTATDKSYAGGWLDGSGTVDFRFSDSGTDNHDDILTALEAGAAVTLTLVTDGTTDAKPDLSGSVLITSFSISSSFDDIITGSFSYLGVLALDMS